MIEFARSKALWILWIHQRRIYVDFKKSLFGLFDLELRNENRTDLECEINRILHTLNKRAKLCDIFTPNATNRIFRKDWSMLAESQDMLKKLQELLNHGFILRLHSVTKYEKNIYFREGKTSKYTKFIIIFASNSARQVGAFTQCECVW